MPTHNKTPDHIVRKIIELRKSGKKNKEVAEIMGLKYNKVKSLATKHLGVKRNPPSHVQCEIMANDRLTMTLSQVALKHGVSKRTVGRRTDRSPLKDKFKIHMSSNKNRVPKPIQAKQKLVKPKIVKAPKNGNIDLVSKGHVKLQKNENKFKTLHRNPSDYRSVSMFDSKNTIKQIRKDDPRTDDQIRSDWKSEQERKLKSLRD